MTDGCFHVLNNSIWKIHQLAAGQFLSEQPVRYGKGRRAQNHTCRVSLLQLAGRAAVLGLPSIAFGLIGPNNTGLKSFVTLKKTVATCLALWKCT
jgi:hypothetical protein